MHRFRTISLLLIAVVALFALTGCDSSPDTGSGVQQISVSADNVFDPNPVVVRAGVPVQLVVGQGSGCTAGLSIPPLGVGLTDLTQGGATISLPALQPGRYPLVCQANMVMGELVVE